MKPHASFLSAAASRDWRLAVDDSWAALRQLVLVAGVQPRVRISIVDFLDTCGVLPPVDVSWQLAAWQILVDVVVVGARADESLHRSDEQVIEALQGRVKPRAIWSNTGAGRPIRPFGDDLQGH